jgi:hypothetical protein
MKILKIDHLGIAVNKIEDGKNSGQMCWALNLKALKPLPSKKLQPLFFR